MKKNYLAWNVNPDDYFKLPEGREQLKFLIKFAVLAPSTHNSQPWLYEVGNDYIVLRPNLERKLRISDPENRHLYISLGCALENLAIAADYYGLETEQRITQENDAAIKLFFKFQGRSQNLGDHLIFSIAERRSNRGKYTEKQLNPHFISKILALSNPEIQNSLVLDEKTKNHISNIIMTSRVKAFSNKNFRGEMADYKKTNFTSSPFGMPGFSMGFNSITSLITPFMVRHVNVMKILYKKELRLLTKYTPAFLFISSAEHNQKTWLTVGRMLQHILVFATSLGIHSSINAVPLDLEPIKKILGITKRPQIFVRLGYPENTPKHSPRLQALSVIN